jgi:hypothetical protein
VLSRREAPFDCPDACLLLSPDAPLVASMLLASIARSNAVLFLPLGAWVLGRFDTGFDTCVDAHFKPWACFDTARCDKADFARASILGRLDRRIFFSIKMLTGVFLRSMKLASMLVAASRSQAHSRRHFADFGFDARFDSYFTCFEESDRGSLC